MSIYWFDLVAGVLLLVFAGFGWIRGMVKEIFFTAAWAGAYLTALFFYRNAARLLKDYVTFAPLADLLGFLILFSGVYLLARLLEYVVREKLGFTMPRPVDAPGGALMGLIKGFIVLALFLVALGYWPPAFQTLLANSYLLRLTRYLAHPSGPLGLDIWPSGELKKDLNELKGKVPDLKGGLPSIPAIPELPPEPQMEMPPPPRPVAVPQKTPIHEPQPVSPKRGSVPPPAPPPAAIDKTTPPASATAPSPRVKQIDPVKKTLSGSLAPPPGEENRRMDKFIKSLD